MAKVKRYTLLYAKDFKKLERLVNEYLDKGYTCQGGLSGGTNIYCQGMMAPDSMVEEIKKAEAVALKQDLAKKKAAMRAEENEDDEYPADEAQNAAAEAEAS